MSLTQQHGTTKALIVATIGTIAALGAAYAVRVSTKKKTALPSKEQEQEQHQQEQHQQEQQQQHQQQPVEFYERAPFVYYGGNASDPETYDYDSNPTVYGKILRGELKTRFLLETERFVLFEDIMPRAPLHALIIPKQLIRSVEELDESHVSMLCGMHIRAHKLLREKLPEAYKNGDYKLCFHIPPLNSVDHLHLHVLAPASQMSTVSRAEFHTCNPPVRWNVCLERVITRLKDGETPTPYSRRDGISKIVADTFMSLAKVVNSSNSLTMWQGRKPALKQILG